MGKELRFDGIDSFANTAAATTNLLDALIDEESPYRGVMSRGTITTPVIFTSSPPVKSKELRWRIILWYLYSKYICWMSESYLMEVVTPVYMIVLLWFSLAHLHVGYGLIPLKDLTFEKLGLHWDPTNNIYYG